MSQSLKITGKFFLTLFLEIFYAPVWWYTGGTVWITKQINESIAGTARSVALGLWVKNIFVPMYGQYDVWGRIISFLVRLVNIIARFFWISTWGILSYLVVALWLIMPAALLYIFLGSLLQSIYV